MRIPIPRDGLVEAIAAQDQQTATSPSLQNFRAFDSAEGRIRGGQRDGTVLAYTTRIVGDNPVINITEIVSTYITPE